MESADKHIKKLIKLHIDCAEYYRSCAVITTEEDLIELFQSLSAQRKKMAASLAGNMGVNMEQEQWLLRDVLSYLQKAWRKMKIALIINNREQILYYSIKNEQAMLREYEVISQFSDLSKSLFRQGIHHQQLLKESLRRINEMPLIKYSRQRSMMRCAVPAQA